VQASLQARQQPSEQQQQQPRQQQQQAAAAAVASSREADFPVMGAAAEGAASGAAPTARWAAAAGSLGGGPMRANDFPELPGQSRAAKRRAAQRQGLTQAQSLAQRLGPLSGGVRVIRAADPGAAPPAALPTGRPRMAHSASEPSLARPPPAAPHAASASDSQQSSPALPPPARTPTGAARWGAAPESQQVAAPRAAADGFPGLSAGQPRAAAAAGGAGGWVAAGGGRRGAPPSRAGSPAPQPHEFPSLLGRKQQPGGGRCRGCGGPAAAPVAAAPGASAPAPSTGGVSEGLKNANKVSSADPECAEKPNQ